jgi:nicotinate phosphoribosyltransferase
MNFDFEFAGMDGVDSLLNTDLYKLTMQQAVLELYPNAEVTYMFKNRGTHRFNKKFIYEFHNRLEAMTSMKLTLGEKKFLKETGLFKPSYLQYLSHYQFDPHQVDAKLDLDNNLEITISGPWHETILWEVPLMALISEVYFDVVDTDWYNTFDINRYAMKAYGKGSALQCSNCKWAEFGTRRRRSYPMQEAVVGAFAQSNTMPNFVGTSNVYLAYKYGVKAIGTMAHEWIMGVSALSGLRYANRSALYKWQNVYGGDLGIALTDTFGSDAFFKDFDMYLSKLYDGVRHDSGDPIVFGEKVIAHYEKMGIDPKTKSIIFSDGLNIEKAMEIQRHFDGKIRTAYGIGTNLTNDIADSKALNMVIKLRTVNGVPVVKLSDEPGKATGDEDAVKVAKWTFFEESLA